MSNFFERIFSEEARILKKYEAKALEVDAFKDKMAALKDAELKNKTVEFRSRLKQGETLDDIMTEAFAVIREAARRVIGEYPYLVQIVGSMVMQGGDIAEMKTGEGKTLTSVMCI